MDKSLKVLEKIAHIFNENHIVWSLGASCMLYLRGITQIFNDIDIRISNKDIQKATQLLSVYPSYKRVPNSKYKTKQFYEYKIDNIDIDIMVDFSIMYNNETYIFPLDDTSNNDVFSLNGEKIYLDSIKEWKLYYRLMERTDKYKLLSEQ